MKKISSLIIVTIIAIGTFAQSYNAAGTNTNKVLNLGAGDYLNISKPSSLFGAEECTIEMWFKIDSEFDQTASGFGGLFRAVESRTNRFGLNLSKSLDKFQFLWGNGYGGYGNYVISISKDTWYHLAVVFDNNAVGTERIKLYLNYEALELGGNDCGDWAGEVPSVNLDMKLMQGLVGQIDNFRIWSKVLDISELSDISLTSISSDHVLFSSLIAQYTFEGQMGKTFQNTKDASQYIATLMPDSYSGLVKLVSVDEPAIDNTNVATSISTDKANNDIRISPNPVVEEFSINGLLSAYEYSIYDITGRLVKKGKANGQAVNVSGLTSGTYTVIINNGEVLKFIKK